MNSLGAQIHLAHQRARNRTEIRHTVFYEPNYDDFSVARSTSFHTTLNLLYHKATLTLEKQKTALHKAGHTMSQAPTIYQISLYAIT